MIEFMVAMGVFLLISAAAAQLFRSHARLFGTQQNQANLNMMLRNAAAQMQIDVVNAGNGFYNAADISAWPVGVTITNNDPGSTSCFDPTTFTYGTNCFDQLNVIATDITVPLAHPSDIGANCVSTTSSSLFGTPVSGTLSDFAAKFKSGDELLLVSANGQTMTTTVLTGDPQVTGGKVKFPHNSTGAKDSNGVFVAGLNSAANDPLGISTSSVNNKLGDQFCNTDWILKLAPITYKVDTTDPTNPKLVRALTLAKTQDVVAEQVIGFKVGASVKTADGDYDFRYKASNPYTAVAPAPIGYNNDWTAIRAVRITIIGRTTPSPGSGYHNGFDKGPYKVEAVSVVINPRNLSMND